MIVSARVVNTYSGRRRSSAPSQSRMSCGNAKRTPSLLPIQLLLHQRTRSGQPGRPVLHVVEQLVGVLRDLQVVAGDLALLDQRAGAPAAAVDHLLVGEHGLVDRIPVDDLGPPLGDAGLEHLQEQPLVPLVVAGSQVATSRDQSIARPIACICAFMSAMLS